SSGIGAGGGLHGGAEAATAAAVLGNIALSIRRQGRILRAIQLYSYADFLRSTTSAPGAPESGAVAGSRLNTPGVWRNLNPQANLRDLDAAERRLGKLYGEDADAAQARRARRFAV